MVAFRIQWISYLNEVWLNLEYLLPPFMPHIISSPNPVLIVIRHIHVEPWGNRHHVRLGAKCRFPQLVRLIGLVSGIFRPRIPADCRHTVISAHVWRSSVEKELRRRLTRSIDHVELRLSKNLWSLARPVRHKVYGHRCSNRPPIIRVI